MPFTEGLEEDGFLRSLEPFNYDEIDFLANNCTEVCFTLNFFLIKKYFNFFFNFQILVWHTKTFRNPQPIKIDKMKYNKTNLIKLFDVNFNEKPISH